MMKFHKAGRVLAGLLAVALLVPSASAIFDFEGIPLDIVAQGEVKGDLYTFGTFGLANPPVSCSFTLPSDPVWARAYAGVWGGTEHYSGWAEFSVNGQKSTKYMLYGEDDQNAEVFGSGNGIYWIADDATGQLRSGENTVTVGTSRGEPGNKLDGRVYAVYVVALIEDPAGSVTRYWVAEGCENLHGEGWAGANPTRKDESSVTFAGGTPGDVTGARLAFVLLATAQGQPDYTVFNGHDLGMAAGDIGNERSYDADGGTGIPSRYVDAEECDVLGLLGAVNTVTFERGRDGNGDGRIASAGAVIEGEDYLHPCTAILTLTRAGGSVSPDIVLEQIRIENGYEGETASIIAELKNYGSPPDGPVSVVFSRGAEVIGTQEVVFDYRGSADAVQPWTTAGGTVDLAVSAVCPGDRDLSNNRASAVLTIGSLPDLTVTAGNPYRGEHDDAADSPASPLSPLAAVAGIVGCLLLLRMRPPPGNQALIALLMIAVLCIATLLLVIPGSAGGYADYVLPVTVTNTGGSGAQEFEAAIYIDGEKVAVRSFTEGLAAEGRIDAAVPVFTSPGTHTVAVVVNEDGSVKEQRTDNNRWEGSRAFP